MARPRLAGGTVVASCPSILISPPVTSSSPAISRSSVDLPQPEGPTKTANSPSSMVRSSGGMTSTAPKLLETLSSVMRPMDAPYFTAPKVRPRTSCFWLNQPRIRIGAMAMVEAAESLA
jgi:hypothetical protein